jgi:hypothetical protein
VDRHRSFEADLAGPVDIEVMTGKFRLASCTLDIVVDAVFAGAWIRPKQGFAAKDFQGSCRKI